MRKVRGWALVIAVQVLAAGIAMGTEKNAPAKPKAASATPSAAAQGKPSGGGKGKVLETLKAKGYTYVKVDTGKKGILWAAAPELPVKKGDVVTVPPGEPMAGFRSDVLNRTFDLVYFVEAIEVQGAKKPVKAAAVAAPEPPGAAAARVTDAKVEPVLKASGGMTVEEVFKGKGDLAGKAVTLRGTIVKVNEGIMGKTWFHLQDGSGTAGTSDLVVTTAAKVRKGDTVLVQGTVAVDKDFGYGYRYEVLVEDATVTRE